MLAAGPTENGPMEFFFQHLKKHFFFRKYLSKSGNLSFPFRHRRYFRICVTFALESHV